MYAPVLIFELIGTIALFVLAILVLILFFQKRTSFPRLYVALLAANASVAMVDATLTSAIPAVAESDVFKDAVRAVVSCCVWIPYALVSRRVALTFTRRRQEVPLTVPPVIPVERTPEPVPE
jgi:predicted permease